MGRFIKTKITVICLILILALATGCGYIDATTTPATTDTSPATITVTTTVTATATPTPINPTWTPPAPTSQSQPLPGIADVVALVKPSVVAIDVVAEVTSYDIFNRPYTQEVEGAGSGWIMDASGIIVTNNHVVEGAKSIKVTLDDGRTITADDSAVFTDSLNDLAILKIDAPNLPALKVGDSSSLRVGDWVIAIGNALGQGIRATEGIVSRQGVSLAVDQGQTLYDLIETSAAINPGNSGGPLVNLAGEVIGITSAKVATIGVEGMGYAISTQVAVPIIEELVQKGYVTRPWLGVSLATVNPFIAARYNLAVEQGVYISEVIEGGPAAAAGLKAGDIITGIGSEEIADVQEFTRALHSAKIGQEITITYWRGKTQSGTSAVLAESPAP